MRLDRYGSWGRRRLNEILSVLYVSRSLIPVDGDAERRTNELVDAAVKKNVELHITGALIYTGTDFAQYIERYHKDVE